jgi:hypothetical protein
VSEERLIRVEGALERIDDRLARIGVEVHGLTGTVAELSRAEQRRALRDELRGEEDTEIRRLPARVEALERMPPPVPIWKDEQGRWVIKLALAAAVACAMALSGGLVASDLPGLARAVSAGPVMVPQPVMPAPAMGPPER